MKRTLLSLTLIAASCGSLAAENFGGRISGMAGSGYVTGDYSDGVLLNPSLAASHGKTDDFALVLNAGALGSDEDELIDALDDLVDFTDELRNTAVEDLELSDADRLKSLMAEVDGKIVKAWAGGSLVAALPNDVLPVAFIARVSGSAGLLADIDEGDYQLIDNSINEPFEPEDLQSSVYGRAVVVNEYGLALAKDISTNANQQILIGVTPKHVEVDTYLYQATVANYDEDDLDADNYKVTGSANMLDAGITYINGPLRYGLSVSNINSKKFKTLTNETFELATRTTAAVGYTKEWWKAEVALDLDAVPTFGLGGETQILRAGVEVSPVTWFQLRAGVQRDLEDTIPDSYSLGFGFSPYGVFNLDIAGFTGANETYGGAIQLGLHF